MVRCAANIACEVLVPIGPHARVIGDASIGSNGSYQKGSFRKGSQRVEKGEVRVENKRYI